MSEIIVTGRVTFVETGLPLSNVRVELWEKSELATYNRTPFLPSSPPPEDEPAQQGLPLVILESGYGWLGSTVSNIDGYFSFLFVDPVLPIIESVALISRVYKNNILISEEPVFSYEDPILIEIVDASYDLVYVKDDTDAVTSSYVNFVGQVFDTNGAPFNQAVVYVYENGFRSKTLIGSTIADMFGNYLVKINAKNVGNTDVLVSRSIRIEVLNGYSDFLAASTDIFGWETATQIKTDFHTSHINVFSEHSVLTVAIASIIGDTPIADLVIDPSTNTNELRYVAGAIGRGEITLENIVSVYQVAAASGLNAEFLYGMARCTKSDAGTLLYMTEEVTRAGIAAAMSANIIGEHDSGTIDTFIAATKVYQISQTKIIPIVGETYTFHTVLSSVLESGTIDNFLTAYNVAHDSVDDFWTSFTATYGSDTTKTVQKGLQMATIAGFQPQTMTAVLSTLGSDDISMLARWSVDDWSSIISETCSSTGILCVPASIRQGATYHGDEVAQGAYAQTLAAVTQALYPLSNITGQLGSESGPSIIPDSTTRSQVTTFINNNPTFDSRAVSAYDINGEDWNLSGITDLGLLQSGLLPFQRLLNLVGGNPNAVTALIIDGINSSRDIAQMSWDDFLANYADIFPVQTDESDTVGDSSFARLDAGLLGGGAGQMVFGAPIQAVYSQAQTTAIGLNHSVIGNVKATMSSQPGLAIAIYQFPIVFKQKPLTGDPTLRSLFGSLDYCTCCDCKSVYSPAAYLSDTLHFLSTKAPALYAGLIAKRPDIVNIDLTCKNTDTPMPYIDLINELLELQILYKNSSYLPLAIADFSFQTSCTQEQLEAYPEHTYKDAFYEYQDFTALPGYPFVYDTLETAIFPTVLPFNMPAEESRTYLQHLGISRLDLMKLFCPINQATFTTTPPTDSITNFAIYSEWLGLTEIAATIVTGAHADSSTPYKFYGSATTTASYPDPLNPGSFVTGPWETALSSRLDILLQQTGIGYDDLLQYLTTNYLNAFDNSFSTPIRHITVGVVPTSPPTEDTCQLNLLELVFSDNANPSSSAIAHAFYKKLYRFIKLVSTGKYTIYEWDILLTSMGVTSDSLLDSAINNDVFLLMGRILLMSDEVGIAPKLLAMWWNATDNTSYINYPQGTTDVLPTLYQTIFSNKNVINSAVDNDFINPDSFSISYLGYTGQIANFCGIGEDEVIALLNYLDITLTTTVSKYILGSLYILGKLAKSWKLSIQDFLTILTISDASVLTGSYPPITNLHTWLDNLQYIIDTTNAIQISKFTLAQVNYLVSGVSPADPSAPNPQNIETFLEALRTELNKNPIYVSDADLYALLTNIIFQHFSKEFGVSLQIVTDIFSIAPGSDIILNFLNAAFVPSTYPLSEANIAYIDTLTAGTAITTPPANVGNVVPDFKLHLFYNWYRYFYKIVLISKTLKLRTQEFEYLFFNEETGVAFYFTQLPVTMISGVLCTVTDTAVSVDIDQALWGLLRANRMMDLINLQSLPEDSLGKLLDAARGVITPAIPGAPSPSPITPADPTYLTDINTCFTNWLAVINQDAWGTMLYEVIGNHVTASTPAGLTQNTLPSSPVTSLLTVYFTVDEAVSNFTPTNYSNITTTLNVINIMYWCQRIGLTATSLQRLLIEDINTTDSRNLIIATKGKYDDSSWAGIAQPLRDTIRVKQRDALVAYQQQTSSLIFANLLIDVEMDTCMVTSRVKQAISSVQLYVDRVVLGLETGVVMPVGPLNEWQGWRKWYGIWEANMQVFFYPEDWMEPALRDDKSVFYTEMEAQLKQNPMTIQTVEDAMMTYLQSLNDVARLEPIGTCDQTNSDGSIITHVFSRSYGGSPSYYHRTLSNSMWSSWQPMDVKIGSDHILPYVWNGQLYIFWLTFKTKQAAYTPSMLNSWWDGEDVLNNHWFYNDLDAPNTSYAASNGNQKMYNQIVITLNWSQYKNGKWQNQQIGKEDMLLKISPWIEDQMQHVYSQTTNAVPGFSPVEYDFFYGLTNNNQMSVMELIQSRFYLSPYVQTEGMANSIPSDGTVIDGDLYLMVLFPTDFDWWDGTHNEYADYIKSFHFSDSSNLFEVTQNLMLYKRLIPPMYTAYKNMSLTTYDKDQWASQQLNLDSYNTNTTGAELVTFNYDINDRANAPLNTFIQRSTSTKMLGKSKSQYNLYTKAGYDNPLADNFMYADKVNTFFVQKKQPNYAVVPFKTISLNKVGLSSASFYSTAATFVPVSSPPLTFAATPTLFSAPLALDMFTAVPTNDYLFQPFYHAHVSTFIKMLNEYGVDGLMRPDLLGLQTLPIVQDETDTMGFVANYAPTSLVMTPYPTDVVDFSYGDPYSIYNWELFFHMPMAMAQGLSQNQQFADAQKWFHYIFDPTSNTYLNNATPTANSQKYWKFMPFFQLAGGTIETIDQLLTDIQNNNANAIAQVTAADNDPFQPFAIARLRPVAFMKNVLMKYLDNLIAWGDYLFTQDTIESINEATQLYIMASNILGNPPAAIPQRAVTLSYTFKELQALGALDAIGDASVAIEGYIDPGSGAIHGPSTTTHGTVPSMGNIFYFCLAPNDKLLTYWTTVADRLFKIRHCENISGVAQQLPLFEPPINPALLVQAAAAGLDINSVVNDLSGAGLPNYRYTYMVQKANEFCGDVKALGASLLSALEKSDGEQLALLRQGQEIALLNAILLMKQQQIDEANANIDALNQNLVNAQAKFTYYSQLPYNNAGETQYLDSLGKGQDFLKTELVTRTVAAVLHLVPQFHVQAPFSVGPQFGGDQLGSAADSRATILSISSAINTNIGTVASTKGGWDRRWADWQFQAQSAQLEMTEIQKQILASQIRLEIAQTDYNNQQLQIDNATAVNNFLTSKYTNQELYDWMISQISGTYFQAYQLALNMAKKAEKCYKNELPLSTAAVNGFINSAYWDSLRKGLQAGESLQCDIRNMESSYVVDNSRLLELTKHVSLAMLAPDELVRLRDTGTCNINIPEELYDFDYPGHINRIIKSVSITIPCVAGPYTTIPCTLSHTGSYIRRDIAGDMVNITSVPCSSIATSSAQNDNGMFDFNFRDERYLPFEGAGAISAWGLTLSNASNITSPEMVIRTFDYNTISDVILHVKYTAVDSNNATFTKARANNLATNIQANIIGDYPPGSDAIPLPRYFSLKHEFPNEWYQFVNDIATGVLSPTLDIVIDTDHFPFFCQGYEMKSASLVFAKRLKTNADYELTIGTASYDPVTVTTVLGPLLSYSSLDVTPDASFAMSLAITSSDAHGLTDFDAKIDDIYMLVVYNVATYAP